MTLPQNSLNTETEKKKLGVFNIVLFILLFLAVICISILVYLKSQNIDISEVSFKEVCKSFFMGNKNKEKLKTREIKFDYSEHHVFSAYKGLVVECSKNSIRGLNDSNQEQWVEQINVNNPVLKVTGEYLLIGDLGGREIYFINGKSIKWNKEVNGNIINIDMTDEGYVSVVHETSGYKGMVTIFNRNGNEMLTRTVSDSFPMLAKVSPSGRRYILNSVNSQGIKAETNLSFGVMNLKQTTDITPQKDKLFPFTWYLNGDLLFTVNDASIMCYDQNGKEIWKNEFIEKQVCCGDVLEGKYPVIALIEDDKSSSFSTGVKTRIMIYNKEGKENGENLIESKVKNIKTYSNRIAVNTGREIYILNSKGKLLDKIVSKTDVSELFFVDKENLALVTKSKIIINQIKF
jgi:hypothetical protein